MNNELDKYYELLGVAPGTSGQELKDAYRDLAKVWHPDRFSHDPRLQQKAQEKLKEINEAYEQLTSAKAGRRTRPAPTPSEPHAPGAHAAKAVRRKRPLLVPLTALVFCAVFFLALRSLIPTGARPAPEQTPPSQREEAQPSDKGQQPESGTRSAAGQPTRAKERTGRQLTQAATSGDEQGTEANAQELRPMPTVTVTIDPVTGLLATRDCPTVSRMTYPAGGEPHQYCTARHKTKAAAQEEPAGARGSRLKSMGKRLATPLKWLGGERGAEAGEMRDAQPTGGDRPKNE